MCGRTAYSLNAVRAAAAALENVDDVEKVVDADGVTSSTRHVRQQRRIPDGEVRRPNTGPGGEYIILRGASGGGDELESCGAIWGLMPNDGTRRIPHRLPDDPEFSISPHYAMFNARSETIYDKISFRDLVHRGRTCVFAVDGYYEWTTASSESHHQKTTKKKAKQPYFVRYKDKQRPLLLAGLWSCVKTGRSKKEKRSLSDGGENNVLDCDCDGDGDGDDTITTFTILTTDAHPDYAWLHPRQPVVLWDTSIALDWLCRPNPSIVDRLRSVPMNGIATDRGDRTSILWDGELSVYPVTTRMNPLTYQGDDCTVEVKLKDVPPGGIESYFPRDGTMKKRKSGTTDDGGRNYHTRDATPVDGNSFSKRSLECTTNRVSRSPTKCFSHDVPSISSKDASPEPEIDEVMWTCSTCTYLHRGRAKFEYLVCELCGSQRIIPETCDDADGDRKIKAVA
jgi:putative SOS response-associated peptidase YedK